MRSENYELETFVFPIGDDEVLVMPARDPEAPPTKEWPENASTFIKAGIKAGLLTTTALDLLGVVSMPKAVLFEMSPDSYREYKGARLDEVGTYFRAVLRTQQGQTSHQVQLRAVQQAPVPVGANMLAAAQMMAIQAQLDRIEGTLATLMESAAEIMQFLEVQQRAEIEAALQVLRQVGERAKDSGALSDTDWERVVGLEIVLEKQLISVKYDLEKRLRNAEFGVTPKADHQRMNEINPNRVAELARYYWLLSGGVRGWTELLALRRCQEGEFTDPEFFAIKSRMEKLQAEQENILDLVSSVASAAKKSKLRSFLEMLLSDGVIKGGRRDEDEHLPAISKGRKTLENLCNDLAAALTTSSPPKMLIRTEDGATESDEAAAGLQAQNQDRHRGES